MKSWSTASGIRLRVTRVACLGLLFPTFSLAQVVWDNGNGNNRWGTANNWNPNGVPLSTDNVQFNSTDDNATVSDIQLRANRSANSLIFNNVDDNFGLINGTGTNTLTLTSGDITRTAGSSNTQDLSMTTLALGGDAAMNIAGSGSLTIAAAIVDSGGARSLTKSGAGELILSGTNTYSNSTTLSAGTLTLAHIAALGALDAFNFSNTLNMSGGTLKLSTATTNITNLNITGNSIIDFGGAVATLDVTHLTISAGVTLNIINWVNASDFFFATNWTNAAFDTTGQNPMNQVVFSTPNPGSITYLASNTKWLSYGSHEITPLPESSTYGALLLATASGFVYCRRRLIRQPA